MANHINPHSPFWQAPIVTEMPNLAVYPGTYSPRPSLSIYGHVYKLYRETAGHWSSPVTSARVPSYSVPAFPPFTPAINSVPLVDSMAVVKDGSTTVPTGWIYFINRSLTDTQELNVVAKGLANATYNFEVEQLASSDLRARNTPGPSGQAVAPQSLLTKTQASSVGRVSMKIKLPRHSLWRVRMTERR